MEEVYVAGFPFGEKFNSAIKITKGIVSAQSGIGNNFSQIQIDAALQPGNSGGPILDEFGNVMAVAVAKLDVEFAIEEYGAIPENTNFGIKSSVVRSILDSQSVAMIQEADSVTNKRQLGEQITKGTYYISCWMTTAQIQEMRGEKVMFENTK
jgi:S1-C subfamily serine protease